MTIEFMLVKSAKNPLGTPQKVETFEDFARIVQNARSTRKNDTKDGPAICAPMKDNKRGNSNVLPRNWVAIDIDGGKQQKQDAATRKNDTKDGPAICAPMKDNKRGNSNVLPRNWVAIDIDGGKQQKQDAAGKVYTPKGTDSLGISPQVLEALKEVLKPYSCFIYPTHSDTPTARKYRVVMATPKGTDSLGISPQVLEALKEVLKPYSCFIYPTHSDTPTARKYRVVMALDKELGPKDWEVCARNICAWLMEKVPELAEQPDKLITAAIDSASYTPAQIMYTVPKEKAASLELFSGTPIATAQFTKVPELAEQPDKLITAAIDSASYTPAQIMYTVPKEKAASLELFSGTPISTAQFTKGSKTKKKALAKIDSTAPAPEAEGFRPELKHVDPILETLTEHGLILRDMGGGKYAIKCPSGDHDDGSLTSTAYFAPGSKRDNGKRYRYGAICCMHDTCKSKGRGTEAFLSMLGMEYAAYCREIDKLEANPDLFTASSGEYSTVNGVVYLSVYKVSAGKVTKGPKEALFPEIEIIGQARDQDGQGWGRLIAFRNNDGHRLEVLIQDSDLTGKGDNVREALTSAGLPL